MPSQGLTDYTNVVSKVSQNLKNALQPSGAAQSLPYGSPLMPLQHPTFGMAGPLKSTSFSDKLSGLAPLQSSISKLNNPSSFSNIGMGNKGLFNLMSSGPNTWAGVQQRIKSEAPVQDSSGVNLPSGGDANNSRGLDGTKQYQDMFMAAQNDSGTPWQVLAAIMGIESGGENLSANSSGATGVMQVVPKYWQDLANKYGGDLNNPETSIKTAAAILKQNYDKYGSWEQAAAAYLGAIDADGNITGATDSFGTSGYAYVDLFKNNLAALGYGAPSAAEAQNGGKAATGWADGAVQAALQMQGTPYVLGGESPGAFDCSGLMQWAYAKMGKELPRTAAEQYNGTQRITKDQLQPGDLIFFSGTTDAPGVTHVGMYIGNGQMVQAPKEGDVVKISSLNNDFWDSHTYGYGRVF